MAGNSKGRVSSLSIQAALDKKEEFDKNQSDAMNAALEAVAKAATQKEGIPESLRPAKKKVKINLTLDAEIKARLQEYAEARGMSISSLVTMWALEKGV